MKILILSVEGDESNTEINFYNGLNHHVSNDVVAKAIGKCGCKPSRIIAIERSVREILMAEVRGYGEEVEIFFIGDKDKIKDIPSMNKSIDIASKLIKNIYPRILINKEIVCNENEKFEECFIKISGSFFKAQKAGTNLRVFNDFAESANWFCGDSLDFEKIRNDLVETNNEHKKIFDKIIKEG